MDSDDALVEVRRCAARHSGLRMLVAMPAAPGTEIAPPAGAGERSVVFDGSGGRTGWCWRALRRSRRFGRPHRLAPAGNPSY